MATLNFFKNQKSKVNISDEKIYSCELCGYYRNCKSPKLDYVGNGAKSILIISDMPSSAEDIEGGLFPKFHKLVYETLHENGINLYEDCWRVTGLACYFDKNKFPAGTNHFKSCYNEKLKHILNKLQPTNVWIFGETASSVYFAERDFRLEVDVYRGINIPDHENKCWLRLFHDPKMVFVKKDELFEVFYNSELRRAAEEVRKSPPRPLPKQKFKFLTQSREIYKFLLDIINSPPKYLVIDLETSGLLPYDVKHKTWCVGIKTNVIDYTVGFPYQYTGHFTVQEENIIRNLLRKIMQNSEIEKIAHNIQFEHLWFLDCEGIETENWKDDTIISTHLLDNRTGITSLKVQSFMRFGKNLKYGEAAKAYMEKIKPDGLNSLDKMPLDELLAYVCEDVDTTEKLFLLHQQEIPETMQFAYELYVEGQVAMAEIKSNGMFIDVDYMENSRKEIHKQMRQIENEIMDSVEVQKFVDMFGRLFVIPKSGSSDDLKALLFDVIKLQPLDWTDKGFAKLDKVTMERYSHPIVQKILDLRILEKVLGTYIEPIIKAAV